MVGKSRSDGIDVIEEFESQNTRKRSYEPRSDARWTLDVYEYDPALGAYRIQESEILEGVRVENGAAGISHTGP